MRAQMRVEIGYRNSGCRRDLQSADGANYRSRERDNDSV